MNTIKVVIFFLVLSTLLTSFSQAAKCPGDDVRLDHSGGSMELVKHRKQQMNTCYAFAAAEVWDAYRFSHYDKATLEKEKGYYSIPMQGALAINLAKGKVADQFDWNHSGTLPIEMSGDPAKTLNYFMTHPTCVSDKVTDELFTDLPGKNREQKMAYLQSIIADGENTRKLLVSYQDKAKGKKGDALSTLQNEYNQKYQKILSDAKSGEADACFKKGNLDRFLDEYIKSAQFSENSLTNILNALINSCEKKSAMVKVNKIPTIQSGIGTGLNVKNNVMQDTQAQALSSIHNALSGKFNKPTQPILLSVCDGFFEGGKDTKGIVYHQNATIDINALPGQVSSKRCMGHAVVAIGRKTEGNQCKILIRNSNQKCSEAKYSKDWKCDEQGDDVWVNEETLLNNTLNYTFFKD